MNKQIETAEHEVFELTPEQIDAVSGAGEIGNAVGYVVGNVIGGAAYLLEKFGKAVASVVK